MFYRINITKIFNDPSFPGLNGAPRHFFATADHSITHIDDCREVYNKLVKAFPEPDYNISVTKWESFGTPVFIGDPALLDNLKKS